MKRTTTLRNGHGGGRAPGAVMNLLGGIGAVACAGIVLSGCATVQPPTTLEKVRSSASISLGYRQGAIPFSYVKDGESTPTGFSVDLCERVVEGLQRQLGLAKLDIKWVPVSADDRVEQVISGAVDLECGTTTITMSRQGQVDFSLLTYVDGGSFLGQVGTNPRSLRETSRMRVAVSAGTTTYAALRDAFRQSGLEADIVPVKSHEEGLRLMREGKADLYASDRTVLMGLARSAPPGSAFVLSETMFSYEPYALMMRHDWAFRVAVDRELASLYRSGQIFGMLRTWFGAMGEPPDLLMAVYLIQGIPE